MRASEIKFVLVDDGEEYTTASFVQKFKHAHHGLNQTKVRYRYRRNGSPSTTSIAQLTEKLEVGNNGGKNALELTVTLEDGTVRIMSMKGVADYCNAALKVERPPCSYAKRWYRKGRKIELHISFFLQPTRELVRENTMVRLAKSDLSHIPAGDLAHLSCRKNTGAARREAERRDGLGLKKYRGGECFSGYTSKGIGVYNGRQ